jgi:hypothetical protein
VISSCWNISKACYNQCNKKATGSGSSLWPSKKEPQVLLPAAYHHLNSASITASRLLPEEGLEETTTQAIINA